MLQEPKFLSAGQFLLTTLIVKLAVMTALATMLARYRRFKHILIFERRNWPDRLVFAHGLAVPHAAGVTPRVLLNDDAADLTLEGAFLAGLNAGPYTGAITEKLKDREKMVLMGQKARSLAKPDAAKDLAKLVFAIESPR